MLNCTVKGLGLQGSAERVATGFMMYSENCSRRSAGGVDRRK